MTGLLGIPALSDRGEPRLIFLPHARGATHIGSARPARDRRYSASADLGTPELFEAAAARFLFDDP